MNVHLYYKIDALFDCCIFAKLLCDSNKIVRSRLIVAFDFLGAVLHCKHTVRNGTTWADEYEVLRSSYSTDTSAKVVLDSSRKLKSSRRMNHVEFYEMFDSADSDKHLI